MKQIAIIGDFRGSPAQPVTAPALLDAARALGVEIGVEWIATNTLRIDAAQRIQPFAGLFIAPGSPARRGSVRATRPRRSVAGEQSRRAR